MCDKAPVAREETRSDDAHVERLPRDVLFLILERLPQLEICLTARLVCSAARERFPPGRIRLPRPFDPTTYLPAHTARWLASCPDPAVRAFLSLEQRCAVRNAAAAAGCPAASPEAALWRAACPGRPECPVPAYHAYATRRIAAAIASIPDDRPPEDLALVETLLAAAQHGDTDVLRALQPHVRRIAASAASGRHHRLLAALTWWFVKGRVAAELLTWMFAGGDALYRDWLDSHVPYLAAGVCAAHLKRDTDTAAVLDALHALGFAMSGLTLLRAVAMYVDFDAGKELLAWLLDKRCPAGPPGWAYALALGTAGGVDEELFTTRHMVAVQLLAAGGVPMGRDALEDLYRLPTLDNFTHYVSWMRQRGCPVGRSRLYRSTLASERPGCCCFGTAGGPRAKWLRAQGLAPRSRLRRWLAAWGCVGGVVVEDDRAPQQRPVSGFPALVPRLRQALALSEGPHLGRRKPELAGLWMVRCYIARVRSPAAAVAAAGLAQEQGRGAGQAAAVQVQGQEADAFDEAVAEQGAQPGVA
ncbi:hypothetical protein HYH02_004627 [Chlamydomonas schloesseri]|uniref:F-box domain-containing protein n=1 Tax=Chlamydomonas schloesseri TaxID=2026947 RepID=A0A835WNK6_9CHLO|nr:hypothetical protein HYH02_004627 [Chlamydomonas schloesseri]|eukprot:KAG2450790.1 hypothetical protein HYH02_004627 [Chlamydomonas schloesseri]